MSHKSKSSHARRYLPLTLLACALTTACGPRLDPEMIVDAVLTTAPFNGALAVIVPRTLPSPCNKLPATQEAQAWVILVNAGFMMTERDTTVKGSPSCQLTLTDRGAQRKSFGRIVRTGNSYEVPVGGFGTDLPVYEEKVEGENANVSFTWKFYRFRGVDGLIALTQLPQRKNVVRLADVPHAGTASAKFRRQDDSWKLEGIKLVQ